ncbi:MAG: hypothetical protein ACE5H2_08620 [Terriglobia bacterium]
MTDKSITQLNQNLKEVESLLASGNVPMRALVELRDAIDHTRHTVWAVLQLRAREGQEKPDPYSILEILTVDRLKRATKLNHEILMDIEASEVTIGTEGMAAFQRTVQNLNQRLQRLFEQGV